MMKREVTLHIIFPAALLFFLTCILFSCTSRKVDPRLERAERMIYDDYETALVILDSIERGSLTKKQDKALYSLLCTMALDKNHLDPKDDSLISVATDYYEEVKDRHRLQISHYYQGRVRFLNDNYASSLLSYFKAMEIAEQDSDFFWAGMSCRGISDIYSVTYQHAEEVTYAEKELQYLQKSGK